LCCLSVRTRAATDFKDQGQAVPSEVIKINHKNPKTTILNQIPKYPKQPQEQDDLAFKSIDKEELHKQTLKLEQRNEKPN
jgi:hypothetical protein